jgi:hypothetical protein
VTDERPTEPVVPDDRYMANVREALGNGYDLVCALCGVGVYDVTDIHERSCPEYRES